MCDKIRSPCLYQVSQLQESIELLGRKLNEAESAHQVRNAFLINIKPCILLQKCPLL